MIEEHYEQVGQEGRQKFLDSLAEFTDDPIEGVEARDYQVKGIRKMLDDMRAGHRIGQFVLGTGGGKTVIAKSLIKKLDGKFLYVGPSKVSRDNGQKEFKKREIPKTSQVFIEGKFDPNVDVTYSTWQALVYDGRYKDIDPSHFDLIIFDEGHNFLGEEVSQISRHFNAHQIYITATPGNSRASLSKVAPHKYFEYGSEDLIRNNAYPAWRVYRHEVENEHLDEAKMIGDEYKLEDGEDKKVLNLPHRFAIAYKLFKESVAKGERRLAFMPSVSSSKEFIDKVINKDPELVGKVVHVDGKTKNLDDIKRRFEEGDILGVCCKDLWNESLDIPEIAAVTLVDPSCSARVTLQRIGRGARPAPGKTHLRIDDVISSIPNMRYAKAMQGKRPLTVHGLLGRKAYIEGAPVNGPEADVIYRNVTKSTALEIPVHERIFTLDISFIANAELGAKLFKEFGKVFGCSAINLILQPEKFFAREEKVLVESHKGESFEIDFKDTYEAAQTFQSLDAIRKELFGSVEEIAKKVEARIKAVIEGKPEPNEKRKEKFRTSLALDDCKKILCEGEKLILRFLWDRIRLRLDRNGEATFDYRELETVVADARRASDTRAGHFNSKDAVYRFTQDNLQAIAQENGLNIDTFSEDGGRKFKYRVSKLSNDEVEAETKSEKIKRRYLNMACLRVGRKLFEGQAVSNIELFGEELLEHIKFRRSIGVPVEIMVSEIANGAGLDPAKFDYKAGLKAFKYEAGIMDGTIIVDFTDPVSDEEGAVRSTITVNIPGEEKLIDNERNYQKLLTVLRLRFKDNVVNNCWNRFLDDLEMKRWLYSGIYDMELENICDSAMTTLVGGGMAFDLAPKPGKIAEREMDEAIGKIKIALNKLGIVFNYKISVFKDELKNERLVCEVKLFNCAGMKAVTEDGFAPPEGVRVLKNPYGPNYEFSDDFLREDKVEEVRGMTKLGVAFEGSVPVELLPKIQAALDFKKPGTNKTFREIVQGIASPKYIYDAEKNQVLVVMGTPALNEKSHLKMNLSQTRSFCKKMGFDIPTLEEYERHLKRIDTEMQGAEEYYWVVYYGEKVEYGTMGKLWEFTNETYNKYERAFWPVLRIPLDEEALNEEKNLKTLYLQKVDKSALMSENPKVDKNAYLRLWAYLEEVFQEGRNVVVGIHDFADFKKDYGFEALGDLEFVELMTEEFRRIVFKFLSGNDIFRVVKQTKGEDIVGLKFEWVPPKFKDLQIYKDAKRVYEKVSAIKFPDLEVQNMWEIVKREWHFDSINDGKDYDGILADPKNFEYDIREMEINRRNDAILAKLKRALESKNIILKIAKDRIAAKDAQADTPLQYFISLDFRKCS